MSMGTKEKPRNRIAWLVGRAAASACASASAIRRLQGNKAVGSVAYRSAGTGCLWAKATSRL